MNNGSSFPENGLAMQPERKCDLLLVDGKNLFWRSAAATSMSIDESPTGGIYAFLKALIRIHEMFGGFIVVCWEGSRRKDLARAKMYPGYKDRGEPTLEREELIKQMAEQAGRLSKLLGVLGVTQARAPRWEADDAMATLARKSELQGRSVGIYSGDSDMCQCVSDQVFVIRPVGREIEVVDHDAVTDWLGVRPGLVPLLKALAGDSSDNIPGVKGVGKVIAARMVTKYGSVYQVMKAAQNGKPSIPRLSDRAWEALRQAASDGQLLLSWRLAKVNRQAKVEFEWSEYDHSALVKELLSLQFKSLLGNREIYKLQCLTR